MIGFICGTKRGFLFKDLEVFCPVCNAGMNIPESRFAKTEYGYQAMLDILECSCGYSSNFIITKEKNLPPSQEFTRTCKSCGAKWKFNFSDAKKERLDQGLNTAKSFTGLAGSFIATLPDRQVTEHNRCNQCGSRNVLIELNSGTQEALKRLRQERD